MHFDTRKKQYDNLQLLIDILCNSVHNLIDQSHSFLLVSLWFVFGVNGLKILLSQQMAISNP